MSKPALTRHPASAALPDLEPDVYGALVDSMRESGFDKAKPIIVCEGEIIVGWHRYLAAHDADVPPVFDARGSLELAEIRRIVHADELTRRHLVSQLERAKVGIRVALACGGTFTKRGRQELNPPNGGFNVTAKYVSERHRVSMRTAERAIDEVKIELGIKPATPPPSPDPEPEDPPEIVHVGTDPAGEDDVPTEEPKPRKRQRRKKPKPQELPPSIPGEDDPDLTAMFESALKDLDALRADNEILEERIKDFTIAADTNSLEVSTKLGNQDEMIRTLNASVNEWMYRHGEARKEANACLRVRKKQLRRIEELEGAQSEQPRA